MDHKVTRGSGILEGFLAGKRSDMADRLLATQEKKRILDIGCGSYPFFLSRANFSEKYGLDKITSRERNDCLSQKINLVDCDIEREDPLPFEDNYFNAVTMLAVIEHIEPQKLPKILKEIHRILSPGGVYIITTPAGWTDWILKIMAKLRLVSHIEIEEHKSAFNLQQLRLLLSDAGFLEQNLQCGSFEMLMNTWISAKK